MIGRKFLAVSGVTILFSAQVFAAAQPGKTSMVFNKRFMPNVKQSMTYDQLTKIIGAPGAVVKDPKEKSPGMVRYHWDGGKDSSLDVRVSGGKVISGTFHAPNGNYYPVGR